MRICKFMVPSFVVGEPPDPVLVNPRHVVTCRQWADDRVEIVLDQSAFPQHTSAQLCVIGTLDAVLATLNGEEAA